MMALANPIKQNASHAASGGRYWTTWGRGEQSHRKNPCRFLPAKSIARPVPDILNSSFAIFRDIHLPEPSNAAHTMAMGASSWEQLRLIYDFGVSKNNFIKQDALERVVYDCFVAEVQFGCWEAEGVVNDPNENYCEHMKVPVATSVYGVEGSTDSPDVGPSLLPRGCLSEGRRGCESRDWENAFNPSETRKVLLVLLLLLLECHREIGTTKVPSFQCGFSLTSSSRLTLVSNAKEFMGTCS